MKALKILIISNGVFVFADRLLGPLFAFYVNEIGGDIAEVSVSWFIFMMSATIMTWVMFKIGDNVVEKEYMLIIGYLIRAFSWGLMAFADSILQLYLLQALIGIGHAIGTPAFDSIFARHLAKGNEIKNYTTWQLTQNFSLAIASLVGGYLVIMLGFSGLLIIMSLLALFSALFVFLQPRKLL